MLGLPIKGCIKFGISPPMNEVHGDSLPSRDKILMLLQNVNGVMTDTIGLSAADYANVEPVIRDIFYISPTEKRDDAAIWRRLLASPLPNKCSLVGNATRGYALYSYLTTPDTTLAKAASALKSTYIGLGLPKWYVSSDGDDFEDGLSIDTAFSTLGKVLSVVQPGEGIGLVTGSVWEESFQIPYDDIFVKTVGAGDDAPIIDGSVIIPADDWTNDATYTNTYKITRTSLGLDGAAYQQIFEDDVPVLTKVASIALCDTTPNSYYYPNTAVGFSYTLYLHPAGSTNPITNGKVYRMCGRLNALNVNAGTDNVKIYGPLTVKRAAAHDGSLRLAGGYSQAYIVHASGGRLHNVYRDSGYWYRITSDGCYSTGSTDFVTNTSPQAADKTAFSEDCSVISGDNTIGTGFFCHSNTIAYEHYKNCSVDGRLYGFSTSGGNGEVIVYEDISTSNIKESAIARDDQFGALGCKLNIIGKSKVVSTGYALKMSNMNALSSVFVCESYLRGYDSWIAINSGAFLIHFEGSIETGSKYHGVIQNTAMSVEANRSILFSVENGSYSTTISGNSYVGDSNLFYQNVAFGKNWNGTQYNTLAAWQAATSADSASLVGDPIWTSNPKNQADVSLLDFTTQLGSPAKTLHAGIEDRPLTYTAPAWVDSRVAAIVNY